MNVSKNILNYKNYLRLQPGNGKQTIMFNYLLCNRCYRNITNFSLGFYSHEIHCLNSNIIDNTVKIK